MVKDAFFFLFPLGALVGLFLYLQWFVLCAIVVAGMLFVAFFFRDPSRHIPADPDAIVSPADGKIIRVVPSAEGTDISIFLSLFNVHVNRAPISGVVSRQEYRPGKFHLAFDDRASVENERVDLSITSSHSTLDFSLIAGLVARRIILYGEQGISVSKGDRIGHIRFGSRVDIRIPAGARIEVGEGDHVRGGSSIIGRWDGGE